MPTRQEYIAYMKTLLGGYGPAQGLQNNDNKFNTWYYGRRVAGNDYAWCSVAECYCENHFDILKLNGGKIAYVPDMAALAQKVGAQTWHRPARVPDQNTSWAQPGNKIVYAFSSGSSGSHTGTFVKKLTDTTFLSYEGNTETTEWSDAFAPKIRSISSVLWVIEVLGLDGKAGTGNTNTEDDVPEYVSLGMKNAQKVGKGGATAIFDAEYGDAGQAHSDGPYPGILVGGKNKTSFIASVEVAGDVKWHFVETDSKKNWAVSKEYPHRTGPFTELGKVEPDQHLWLHFDVEDRDVNAALKCHYWHL